MIKECEQDKVAAFDTLFTTNHIQQLKILLSYLDPSMQKNMAVYIKYLELQYTISYFHQNPKPPLTSEHTSDPSSLCGELLPYCDEHQRVQMENMQNMMQTFSNYREMMEMMQMFSDMQPGEDDIFQLFQSMKGGSFVNDDEF